MIGILVKTIGHRCVVKLPRGNIYGDFLCVYRCECSYIYIYKYLYLKNDTMEYLYFDSPKAITCARIPCWGFYSW
jgi:hypothetical protein